jgi:hypothetical protein
MSINLSSCSIEDLENEIKKRQRGADIAERVSDNPLKCREVTTITVSYNDLEYFIRKVFGVEYESACVEEMSNDSQRSYTVDGLKNDPVTDPYTANHTIPEIEEFLNGNRKKEPALSDLLNYFAMKNYISKGNYTVKWSW